MNPKWRKLAADCLAEAADGFCNHGCNDWDYPADWTPADRLAFAAELVRWNAGGRELIEQDKEDLEWFADEGPPDWLVMDFLADQLRKEGA